MHTETKRWAIVDLRTNDTIGDEHSYESACNFLKFAKEKGVDMQCFMLCPAEEL